MPFFSYFWVRAVTAGSWSVCETRTWTNTAISGRGWTAPQTKGWQLTEPPLSMQWRQWVQEGRGSFWKSSQWNPEAERNNRRVFCIDFHLNLGSTLPKWPLLISLNAKTGTVLGERSFSPGSLQLRLMRLWVQGDTETKKPQSSCLKKLSFRIWWDSKGTKHVKSALKENSAKQRFLNKRLRWSHLSFQSLFLTSLVTPSYIYIYAALEFLLPLSGQTEGKFPFLTRNRQFLDNKLLIKHNMVSVIPWHANL